MWFAYMFQLFLHFCMNLEYILVQKILVNHGLYMKTFVRRFHAQMLSEWDPLIFNQL